MESVIAECDTCRFLKEIPKQDANKIPITCNHCNCDRQPQEYTIHHTSVSAECRDCGSVLIVNDTRGNGLHRIYCVNCGAKRTV